MVSELETPVLPWSNVKKEIQRVGDIGVTLSFKTHSSTQKSVHPKDAPSRDCGDPAPEELRGPSFQARPYRRDRSNSTGKTQYNGVLGS